MELSTYFRINAENTGQFERTLIIADKGSYVSYLEGCTAPKRDTAQLHAAVVEIVVEEDAEVKYSTVQNWFPGDENGNGGIYNFVTKRADCRGDRSKVMWTQVETGSAVTWKYPSCILRGDESQGEFYSIAIANNHQQADTGTKMLHLGKNTKSRIVSKGISAGVAQNTYRGQVNMHPRAKNSRNYTQCDSLLIGDKCGAHTVPYIEVKNNSSRVEHEATTSKVDDDQLFYCRQRGMGEEEAVALVVNGFCKDVLQALPMEFAMEAQQLVAISLEDQLGSCDYGYNVISKRRIVSLMVEKMLKINNLHVSLEDEDKEILKGVDLTVDAGKVHAIMGPNGSGKSTLSYVLSGKEGYNVTDGSVELNGDDIMELEPEERALLVSFGIPVSY